MDFLRDAVPLHPDYPLPDVDDPIMRPFWDGAREGRLVLQRDRTTGAVQWPPKPTYWKDGARLEWFVASGRGTIHSWVVGQEPFLPAFRHLLPLVMVLVAVEEGPRLVGYMVNATPEEMRFGMPVRVRFKQLNDRVTLPVWEPLR
ncbi:MAG TPA: OB-fold domain-containing protein [Candidatus Binatia bacterium]|nr:OB-fold domain-containing protein [Candidatus Binatia bacterium]